MGNTAAWTQWVNCAAWTQWNHRSSGRKSQTPSLISQSASRKDITIQASFVHRICKLQPSCIWRISKPCISPSHALEKICTQELFHSSYTPTSCIPTLPGAANVQQVNGCCGRSHTVMGIPSQVGPEMFEPNFLSHKRRDREMHPQP